MTGRKPFKPTKQQLIEAAGKTLPDVIARDLKVLFCGINPGLYTAAVGHHFARPGNRFWPALHQSGFTSQLISPFDERELLKLGVGISNVVPHATASAAELTRTDFEEGGRLLAAKVKRFRPRIVAILGVGAYRQAFNGWRAAGAHPLRPGLGPAKPERLECELSVAGTGEVVSRVESGSYFFLAFFRLAPSPGFANRMYHVF
jgi:TDG/mug DNA glycosylase family protein